MTAWVIPIGAEFPDHWPIARDHGAWDLTRRAAIEPSDDVVFWLGGTSVLAWVRATSPATSLIPHGPIIPWEDRETSRYVARFTFEMISEDPVAAPPWGQVKENIETRSGLNTGPVMIDGTKGIQYLRSLFRTMLNRLCRKSASDHAASKRPAPTSRNPSLTPSTSTAIPTTGDAS